MSRSRLPTLAAWLQCLVTLRVVTLLSAFSVLSIAVYLGTQHCIINSVLFIAAALTIAINDAEIVGLTSKSGDGVKRPHISFLVVLEIFAVVLYIFSYFVTFDLTTHGEDLELSSHDWWRKLPAGHPYDMLRALWVVVLAILGLHMVNIIVCAADAYRSVVQGHEQDKMDRAKDQDLEQGLNQR